MEKLPEEFKKKWIAALRSGEYKQGRNRLNDKFDNSFCCLGVACHVALGEVPNYHFIPRYDPDMDAIPGLIRGNTELTVKLAVMNDTDKKSFFEIADWIEENL